MVANASDAREKGQIDVTTSDGSKIAVWVEGQGPPLVLVHGSLGDHTGFTALVEEMKVDFTTFALDRRGFGASADDDGYSIEREFDDVATVVDAVAAQRSGSITLMGHSFGANCAMGGAARTPNVRHLVLYEPSLGLRSSPESVEAVENALAADSGRQPC